MSTPWLSACRIPNTTKNMPTADRIAPTTSNGRVGSGGTGSTIRRLSKDDHRDTTAWKMNAARQLIAVVMRPPISGPAAAPMPPNPLITPNARARRRQIAEGHRREDVDGRDQQRRADPFEHRVAEDQHAETGDSRAQRAPIPYSVRPPMKHRLRPQRSVSLLPGIMRTAMISKNSVIATARP